MNEFNPHTYQPGTYPDVDRDTLYQVAYSYAWGIADASRQQGITPAARAEFAYMWAATPHDKRQPLPMAHAEWLKWARCDHDRDSCPKCETKCRRCEHRAESLDDLGAHVAASHVPTSEYDCDHCGRIMGH